jgi:A/G-specific adenine glycosylase
MTDFLHIGKNLLEWYKVHGRDLPFRKTKDPYKIWICEIIFQQTRIQQGLNHYNHFIKKFPNIETLAKAETEDVLLCWKGLGYYSRALNIQKAAQQIMENFGGKFPENFEDILKLKGIGKYTASAISSICFGENFPAVDGNFYRVLSRIFADDFDISRTDAFSHFSELALKIMPPKKAGDFNQAMMDLGSEICKPKNPSCAFCPLNKDCVAFNSEKIQHFPVKLKHTKITNLHLKYYFVEFKNEFLIRQRPTDFIWKKLYEFPTEISRNEEKFIVHSKTVNHKLTHLNLTIEIEKIQLKSRQDFENFAKKGGFIITDFENSQQKSFPKPLENYIKEWQSDL